MIKQLFLVFTILILVSIVSLGAKPIKDYTVIPNDEVGIVLNKNDKVTRILEPGTINIGKTQNIVLFKNKNITRSTEIYLIDLLDKKNVTVNATVKYNIINNTDVINIYETFGTDYESKVIDEPIIIALENWGSLHNWEDLKTFDCQEFYSYTRPTFSQYGIHCLKFSPCFACIP